MSMPIQKDITDAYLAGIIDGEGCVRITRHKTKSTSIGYRFEPYLDISNTDKKLLVDLQKYLNAGRVRAKTMHKNNVKQGYVLNIYGRAAGQVLTEVLPYLRVKRKQAALVIEYANTFCRGNRVGYRLTTKQRQKQHNLFNKLALLNKKGV